MGRAGTVMALTVLACASGSGCGIVPNDHVVAVFESKDGLNFAAEGTFVAAEDQTTLSVLPCPSEVRTRYAGRTPTRFSRGDLRPLAPGLGDLTYTLRVAVTEVDEAGRVTGAQAPVVDRARFDDGLWRRYTCAPGKRQRVEATLVVDRPVPQGTAFLLLLNQERAVLP